jgi:hypothetical protein
MVFLFFFKADLMISELLGSFGDNELSPECLDGAQKFLNIHHGINIPENYTSYVAPVMSQTLHQKASALKALPSPLETFYVVLYHNAYVFGDVLLNGFLYLLFITFISPICFGSFCFFSGSTCILFQTPQF